ncbi:uncharacterized protein ARB_07231 [Trichophyton benhamiae CBS 112371]|uniref:Uncharacterized protein n=1 Tax=Arthroderma benhamiae (strain ATCC MYA-4681 / CBS 112371) TaxID=663331 RepID=D4ASL6_ARTBC|nr:uncharacterized protein ARB_07231 [Trichophyton benhamiae CBS 112371]EFE33766.1 hypothetical protein ARB_07231 [Trichophyton benhamiae CBS 112371]
MVSQRLARHSCISLYLLLFYHLYFISTIYYHLLLSSSIFISRSSSLRVFFVFVLVILVLVSRLGLHQKTKQQERYFETRRRAGRRADLGVQRTDEEVKVRWSDRARDALQDGTTFIPIHAWRER